MLYRVIMITGLIALFSCSSKEKDKELAAMKARLAEMEFIMTENNKAEEVQNAFDPLAKIAFEDQTITIDSAKVGEPVEVEFVVKSEGEAPLIIHNVNTPCGCTVPDWTQTPIEPGDTGNLLIKYTPKVSDVTLGEVGVSKRAQLITNAGNVKVVLQVKKVTK